MLDNVGLRYPHRTSGAKPLALCDRCPCFGSLYPPLAALTFAAQSIICAFGLAAAAPRSPYRHLGCAVLPKHSKGAAQSGQLPLLCLGNTAQFPPYGLSTAPADLRAKSRRKASVALRSASLRLGVRHGICVAKMLDNVGLRYPHRTSGAKAPRTLRPLPLLRFAVSATGGAHLCSTKYYLRFWLSSCRTSLAVSALRIVRCC